MGAAGIIGIYGMVPNGFMGNPDGFMGFSSPRGNSTTHGQPRLRAGSTTPTARSHPGLKSWGVWAGIGDLGCGSGGFLCLNLGEFGFTFGA